MTIYRTSNKTKAALIEAVGELAVEKGFSALTTRAIAERAGENIGSIHYHFGGRDQLFEAVLHHVVQDWIDNPLDKCIADCDLSSQVGKIEALKRTVIRFADLLFDEEKPNWHCRTIYQLLRHQTPLRNLFRKIIMDREYEQFDKLLSQIKPGLNKEMQFQHFNLLFAPQIIHSDYSDVFLQQLEQEEYSREYLQTLIDQCIEQSLLRYQLPLT
jgi:AcrR family transcriptional regulator